ncbi:glycosyltransferase family 2 protein [Pseudoalteromonas sp. SR41-1]|uniref:glycosyltransferase family 2 protein n=1 Tax=Pseudoalteromonas sp. SR41-1 TaxID=2760952 RepID=UPI0015FF5C3A|nr:glycosyltransferase family 2 protein [Pseudoalteromonas sp. SR41-1]MBB1279862.1 glycosyltransferase family 2 protein [Pseudoalteromonas sp. SR41-1]
MSKIIIGIVSHGHYEYISKNEELLKIAELNNVYVVIKDNIKEGKLENYVKTHELEYVTTNEILGFGENNNFIFNHAKQKLNANNEDWFIIFNPDVVITLDEFKKLIVSLTAQNGAFFAPNLFKSEELVESENSVRYFPKLTNLFNPFLMKPINSPYNKDMLNEGDIVEWASGAFLCIKCSAFELVSGFNEKYFMYYEDVDLCYRLNKANISLRFLKNISAVHKGEYKNRSIFSKHFLWYLNSLTRFLFTKR